MSLLADMTRASDGTPGPVIDWSTLSRFLNKTYWQNDENKKRKERAASRQRFYMGKGEAEMFEMLGRVFKDPEVIELRAEWIEYARFNMVLRRAVHELATVYSQPATRTVDGDDNNVAASRMLDDHHDPVFEDDEFDNCIVCSFATGLRNDDPGEARHATYSTTRDVAEWIAKHDANLGTES